ncbi:MAG: S1/P1 nuclease [Acidobacteriota bacterium]|nr:S1/P1 nuclease [Acidobacteriota bacterium]
MRTRIVAIGVVVAVVFSWPALQAWGGQGHRLVGLVAANHLSRTAAQNVNWLLDGQSLADVSNWADAQITDLQQTATWHYLNIPPAAAGSRGDTWRDCIVDRITYFEQRTADIKLDRADRATALKISRPLHRRPAPAVSRARRGPRRQRRDRSRVW